MHGRRRQGIVFLGQARTRHVRRAREVDRGMRAGQGLLALLCLAFGVAPALVVDALRPIARTLLGGDLRHATSEGWLLMEDESEMVLAGGSCQRPGPNTPLYILFADELTLHLGTDGYAQLLEMAGQLGIPKK